MIVCLCVSHGLRGDLLERINRQEHAPALVYGIAVVDPLDTIQFLDPGDVEGTGALDRQVKRHTAADVALVVAERDAELLLASLPVQGGAGLVPDVDEAAVIDRVAISYVSDPVCLLQ